MVKTRNAQPPPDGGSKAGYGGMYQWLPAPPSFGLIRSFYPSLHGFISIFQASGHHWWITECFQDNRGSTRWIWYSVTAAVRRWVLSHMFISCLTIQSSFLTTMLTFLVPPSLTFNHIIHCIFPSKYTPAYLQNIPTPLCTQKPSMTL